MSKKSIKENGNEIGCKLFVLYRVYKQGYRKYNFMRIANV